MGMGGTNMRNSATVLLTAAALGFGVGHASAGGYPSSGVLPGSPSLFAPPQHVWTNIYVGLNAGGAFGDFSASAKYGPLTADLGSVRGSGFAGGGQVGAQIQYGHVVYGIEGDFQGSAQDHSNTYGALTVSEKMPWFSTIRGRVGWALDNVLLYGTGGMAIVDGKISATAYSVTYSKEDSKIGWTAGGGVEWAFAPHWTAKVEYLYLDSTNIEIANIGGLEVDGRIRDNIVRGGINYYIYNTR
jgi:outer membrane immunogenic protein